MAPKPQPSPLVRAWAFLFACAVGVSVGLWLWHVDGAWIVLVGAIVVSFVLACVAFMARVRREMAKVDRGQR